MLLLELKINFNYQIKKMVKNSGKNSENNRCLQGCEEIGTFVHGWWDCKMEQQLLPKIVQRFLKELKRKLQL